MALIITWFLPIFALLLLVFDLYRGWKRGGQWPILNAIVSAVVALVLCMGNVMWTTTVPIFLWWIIAVLAGVLVSLSMWRGGRASRV